MALAQFLLPGEEVRYESAGPVRHGRTPYTLYVTGERLLLYTAAGRFAAREGVIAESLSDVDSLEYEEGGFFFDRGRLRIRFHHDSITLTGEPDVMKEVWRELQQYTFRTPAAPSDDEMTLVVPPAPLFDDQPSPPARVQPLPLATAQPRHQRQPASASRLLLILAAACLAVLAGAAAYRFRHRFTSGGGPPPQAAVTPAPAPPAPTPLSVQIMDESFTLEAGAHRAVKFTIPPGQPPARLSGGFRVTAGDYIDFYLMNEGQYDRFAAGGPPDVTSALYRKDQWNARVGERVAAGSYYLVFDNGEGGGAQTVAGQFLLVFD